MIELQVLNKILQDKSMAIIINNGINADYFIGYSDEFNFISNHYKKYGKIPDKATFLNKFEEFEIIDVQESESYLVETLKENYLFYKITPFVQKTAELAENNSMEAVQYVRQQMEDFKDILYTGNTGYDLIKNSYDRRNEYEIRLEAEGLLGISTGIEELDKITHGWLKNDFVPITGRTNEGKSWIMLYFLVQAWKNNKKVLLYSGEMGKSIVGFRFDTLNAGFCNLSLMQGSEDLGDNKTQDDYYEYLNTLNEIENNFIIITPGDLGGNRLDIQTLHQLIERYNPDIIGVDQISLMEDYRKERGQPNRLKYTHIAEDLYLTSEKYEIPILAPAQSNRDAKKNKNDEAPELVHVAESDGIVQNATRVLSIKQIDETLKISLKKNRYGMNNMEVLLITDWNNGVIKPLLEATNDDDGNTVETKDLSEEEGEELF